MSLPGESLDYRISSMSPAVAAPQPLLRALLYAFDGSSTVLSSSHRLRVSFALFLSPLSPNIYPLMSWRDDPFSFSLSTKHSSTLGEWKTRVRFPSLFLVRKDSRILTFPVHERRSRKTLMRFAETPSHAVLATRDLSLSRILQS
ncbi:hypothetical protein ALC53_06783 [Atta colombica]|uniref:Uncharacterized protein n=1 Tax=Atta colombica TaxID=520822 RepID=A0A151I3T3_9HYME|nr:hypothetical protein ALC53_06783 [Atta colombica]